FPQLSYFDALPTSSPLIRNLQNWAAGRPRYRQAFISFSDSDIGYDCRSRNFSAIQTRYALLEVFVRGLNPCWNVIVGLLPVAMTWGCPGLNAPSFFPNSTSTTFRRSESQDSCFSSTSMLEGRSIVKIVFRFV